MAERNGNYMLTHSGVAWYPYDPRVEDVRIEDIAHALSMLCRYGGHCRKFYSVAEHSVIVSRLVPREHALCGLLHDATEAYLVDMPKPVKVGMPQYYELEAKLWAVIAQKFGLPAEIPDAVHEVDEHMIFHEQAAIMPPLPAGKSWGMGRRVPALVRPDVVRCWSQADAKRFFMNRFQELSGG